MQHGLTRRVCRVLAGLAVAVSGLAVGALPAAAAAPVAAGAVSAGSLVITAFSQRGDYIGGGVPDEFDKASIAAVTGTAATTGINLDVTGGTAGHFWIFRVDPPRGRNFHVGEYPDVQAAEERAGRDAGLDISGGGHGCNAVAGSVEVRDLAASGPRITRLDLLYTQYCEGSTGALFGEIRIGEPQPGGVLVSSAAVTWPPAWAGTPATTVPLYIRNHSAQDAAAGKPVLAGYAASEYHLTGNGCSGTVLAPGASCSLSVSFAPTVPGPRPAALRIRVGKTWEQVQLDAPVPAGTTGLSTRSQPGDFVGEGRKADFTPGNAGFYLAATPAGLTEYVRQDGGWVWVAELAPAAGHTLTAGTYRDVSTTGPGNVLDVVNSHGCDNVTGSFRVTQAVFSGSRLEHFAATFTQHCEGARPALAGEIKYASAPVTTAPPGVARLSAKRGAAGKVTLSWRNPAGGRYRYTVVRAEPYGVQGVSPSAGLAGYAGRGHSTTIGGLSAGKKYLLVAYTVDQYGNVSHPAELAVKASRRHAGGRRGAGPRSGLGLEAGRGPRAPRHSLPGWREPGSVRVRSSGRRSSAAPEV